MKKVFINGVSGQDGAYLARLLLNLNYEVYGGVRSIDEGNYSKLRALGVQGDVRMVECGLQNTKVIESAIEMVGPDEIYNFSAQSSVAQSWLDPISTYDVNATGVIRILEVIRKRLPGCKFFQASSSEMFGNVDCLAQDELTPLNPLNPYGVSKLAAFHSVRSYRNAFGLFAANGILFNHESPLRPDHYVSRKITRSIAKIKLGELDILRVGNLDIKRDWGFACDYVEGMHKLMQNDHADDVVFATGKTHSIREFIQLVAEEVGYSLTWRGNGVHEVGVDSDGKVLVEVDERFYRATDMMETKGDPTKAFELLGWAPKMSFQELAKLMVSHDLEALKNNGGVSFENRAN